MNDSEVINKVLMKSIFLSIKLGQDEICRAVELMNINGNELKWKLNLKGTEAIVYNSLYAVVSILEEIITNYSEEDIADIRGNIDKSMIDCFMSGFSRFHTERKKELNASEDIQKV